MADSPDSVLGKLARVVRNAVSPKPEPPPLPPADKALHRLLSRFADEATDVWARDPKTVKAGQEIFALAPEQQLLVLYAAYTRLVTPNTLPGHFQLTKLCSHLLRAALPFTAEPLAVMLAFA